MPMSHTRDYYYLSTPNTIKMPSSTFILRIYDDCSDRRVAFIDENFPPNAHSELMSCIRLSDQEHHELTVVNPD